MAEIAFSGDLAEPSYAKSRQRHHKTDRAKSALRSALVDHRLLDGRQFAVRGVDAFDRDDVLAGRVRKRHQARRHRPVSDLIADKFADEHRTRTAIALAAADLGALQVLVIPHEIEHRRARRLIGRDIGVVEDELGHLRQAKSRASSDLGWSR